MKHIWYKRWNWELILTLLFCLAVWTIIILVIVWLYQIFGG